MDHTNNRTRDQADALLDDGSYCITMMEEFYNEHLRYPSTDELIRWHRDRKLVRKRGAS